MTAQPRGPSSPTSRIWFGDLSAATAIAKVPGSFVCSLPLQAAKLPGAPAKATQWSGAPPATTRSCGALHPATTPSCGALPPMTIPWCGALPSTTTRLSGALAPTTTQSCGALAATIRVACQSSGAGRQHVQSWHFAGSLALPVDRQLARSQTYVVPNPADHATRGSSLSWPARVYVSIVIAAGASTLVAFFPRTYPRPALLAALIIFSCVTSLWKVNLPISTSSGSTLSVSHAANLMALLLLGLPPAMVVAVAGVLAQCTYKVKKSYPLYRTLFSVAAAVLTMATTSVAYRQLGGSLGPVDMAELAKPIIGAIAVYFVVNTSLIAGAIALTSRRSFFNVWRGDFLWSGVSFMVAGSAGAMAAAVVARGDHWKAILLIAPIYLTYRTYEVFVGRLADQTRHMAEMRQLHQGTVEALAHAQQAEQAEQVARAAAERANRLKDQFLAVVSHELRTPLTAILGWAGMLRRGQLDEGRRDRAFQSIYDSARRQAQLIDDLLDVSRIMSGTLRIERTAIDLKTVVDDAIRTV